MDLTSCALDCPKTTQSNAGQKDVLRLCVVTLLGVLFLNACTPPEKSGQYIALEEKHHFPIFNGQGVILDSTRLALLDKWDKRGVPGFTTSDSLGSGWFYGPGNPENGLRVSINEAPPMDSLVVLRHNVLKPDWPLWYQQQIALDGYGWVYVEADDGAQVFQDGVLLEPVLGEYFKLDTTQKVSDITIRVLNNALAGGLRDVRLVRDAEFKQYLTGREHHLDMMRVLYEAFRVEAVTAEQHEALTEMLDKPSKESIATAKALFQTTFQYPHLVERGAQQSDSGFQFTAWGDSQSGWEVFVKIIAHMVQDDRDDFSIGLGDLVDDGAKEEHWLAYAAAVQPLLAQVPVYSIAGNHDYDGYYNTLVPELYFTYTRAEPVERSFFSWTYQGAYFLALDPSASFPLQFDPEQVDWMNEEMNSDAWRNADWRFVLIHQSPYAQGWPGYHGDAFIKEWVDSLAAPKNIDFVLAGHNHDYERLAIDYEGHTTNFFIIGGAGGGLEPPENSAYPEMDLIIKEHHYARFNVRPDQVEVSVIGLQGQELDRLMIRKP